MKTISNDLAGHLAGEVTTLCTCWKLTRVDSIVLGFTDHDKELTVSGVTYQAASGFNPTAIAGNANLAVDNLDVEGLLSSDAIAEADVLSGLYDFAEVDIFLVNYADLSQGRLDLRSGWLGEVTLEDGRFTAELRGLAQRLTHTIGELYSPSCRAQLGDPRCKVALASYTVTGTVTACDSNMAFSDAVRLEAANRFAAGSVTFTSGLNAGRSMEIKEFAAGRFTLVLPMPRPIAVGDAYSAVQGCDKTLATCRDRFSNVVNFRGEPHVPGLNKMLETAGTFTA